MSSTSSSDDLLVFGYSCTIFRDDDRALAIDRGEHLIPFLGRRDFPIDRYDARGAIMDTKELEVDESAPLDPLAHLSPEDRQIEEFCDDERYRSVGQTPEAA